MKITITICAVVLLLSVITSVLFALKTDADVSGIGTLFWDEMLVAQWFFGDLGQITAPSELTLFEDVSAEDAVQEPVVQKPAIQKPVAVKTFVSSVTVAEKIATSVHREVNRIRGVYGISPVVEHSAIARVALQHSADMRRNTYFSHVDLAGQKPLDRFGGLEQLTALTGCQSLYSENLAKLITGSDYRVFVAGEWRLDTDRIAERVVQMWMESTQGHRENMLMYTHRLSGIGVSVSAIDEQYGYTLYVTQNFCS